MKILLDECVDSRLARQFSEFEVQTVYDRGWSGITNGKLLALAQVEFDVFVTVDRNLAFQQNIPKFSLAVILVHSVSNRLSDLIRLVPDIQSAIPSAERRAPSAERGAVTNVGRYQSFDRDAPCLSYPLQGKGYDSRRRAGQRGRQASREMA